MILRAILDHAHAVQHRQRTTHYRTTRRILDCQPSEYLTATPFLRGPYLPALLNLAGIDLPPERLRDRLGL